MTINDVSKNDVFSVEPGRFRSAEEKLRSVSVWARVRHRKRSRAHVVQLEVFVGKGAPVNRLAARSVSVREIAALENSNMSGSKSVKNSPAP